MIGLAHAQSLSDSEAVGVAMTRIFESSPVIVVVLVAAGLLVWRAWREDRKDMAAELRDERKARMEQAEQIMEMGERHREAIQQVRDAIMELRHALHSIRGGSD